MDYAMLKDFAGPVATIIAATVAAYFAYRFGSAHAHNAQQTLVLSLFDKRWEVANELRSAMAAIGRTGRVDPDSQRSFLMAAHRARFLFGPEVTHYLENVRSAMVEHGTATDILTQATPKRPAIGRPTIRAKPLICL